MNHFKNVEDLPFKVLKGAVNICFIVLCPQIFFFFMSYLSLSMRAM